MNSYEYLKKLDVPTGKIDVVLDTDAFNEIDDQFAIAYLLKKSDRLNTKALYAAPFFNENSSSPENGMEKSYLEILKILDIMKLPQYKEVTFRGSTAYLENETTPVISDAAKDLVKRAMDYSAENPLYVVAIGAITNVASALLTNPEIKDRIVIVWLGGHSYENGSSGEFNMMQDIAAARIIFSCGAPVVQLPGCGVVSAFTISFVELEHHLKGKNELCDYLVENVRACVAEHISKRASSRVIWDVTAVAWLLNDNDRFMTSRITPAPIPEYDYRYAFTNDFFIRYVDYIHRDELATDLLNTLSDGECFK